MKDYLELSQNEIHKDSKNTIMTSSMCSLNSTCMFLSNPGNLLPLKSAFKGGTDNKNSDDGP